MSLPSFSYIALPPPRQDKSSHPTTNIRPKTAPPSSNLKHNFFLRVSAFSILEIGFIILAYTVGQNPIPLGLPSNITLAEAKGTFTVISILWHALAIFIVKDILLHIFSAEWMEQYYVSGSLVPGKTDIVSRMTSGFFDQLKHFTSDRATLPFRLGFMGSVLLIFLNALGPSVISVSSIFLEYPLSIKVANLTMTEAHDKDPSTSSAIDRADGIVKIEIQENVTYGFRSEENVLIPWPSQTLISTNGTVKYESDVITYNFSCSWKQSMVSESMTSWTIDNSLWVISPLGPVPQLSSPATYLGLILPMVEVSPADDYHAFDNPLSGFLFLGANSTLRPNGNYIIDLGDIPTNSIPTHSNSTFGNAVDKSLVSVLVCDPQMHLAPATVTLSDGHLQAVTRSGPPVVKNFPVEAANVIFSESLLISMSPLAPHDPFLANTITRIFFLAGNGIPPDYLHPSKLKPLPLDQINQNMNRLLLSSAKAYLSGYWSDENRITPLSLNTLDTNATAEAQRLALTGSRPFLIALLAVVCTLMILLVFLVAGLRVDRLQTFDLENIFKALKID